MKKRLAWLLLSSFLHPFVACRLAAQTPSRLNEHVLVITHVAVIDATGAPAAPDEAIAISGDRIAEIAKSGKIRVPKGAHVVDAKGKFLIPGLWDMHVHLD